MKKNLAILLLVVMMLLSFSLSACNPGDCSTCKTPTSGGQIMNPDNAVTNIWQWLEQFDTTD